MGRNLYDSEIGLVDEKGQEVEEVMEYGNFFRLTPMERSILAQSEMIKNRKPGYKKSLTESLKAICEAEYKGTDDGLELSVYDKLVISVVGRTMEKGTVKDLKEIATLLGETKEVKVKEFSYDVLVNEGKIKEEY